MHPRALLPATAVLLILIGGAVLVYLSGPQRTAAQHYTAARAEFETHLEPRHYRILIGASTVGTLEETRSVLAGRPQIASRMVTHLPGLGWSTSTTNSVFEATAPGRLVHLGHHREAPLGTHYEALHGADDLPDFTLHDAQRLGRLARSHPVAGARAVGEIDPVRGTLTTSHWQHAPDSTPAHPVLIGQREDGTGLRADFDARGELQRLRIGSGFEMVLQAGPVTLDATARTAAPLRLPVDRRLGPAAEVATLALTLNGPAADLFEATPTQQVNSTATGQARLFTRRQPADALPPQPRRALMALLDQVHTSLRYQPGVQPPSVEAALLTGVGDCHEFAMVFQRLARDAGFDSRTVTGLAWMGDSAQAFGLHAWNEIRSGETWISVDPTWRQIGVDATHLRFPLGGGSQLDLQLALADSALQVDALTTAAGAERATPGPAVPE